MLFICDDVYASATPQAGDSGGISPLIPFPAVDARYTQPNLASQSISTALGANEDYVNAGVPAIVQYFSSGANTNRNGITSTSYVMRICNLTSAGNCLVLIIDCQHNNTFTGISDDVGNTWSTTPSLSVDAGVGLTKTCVFVLPNAIAGGRNITIGLGTADDNFKFIFIEVANVALQGAVGATVSSISTTAPNVSAGNITPRQAGSMLLAYAIDNSALIGDGAQALTGITAGSGWTTLTGDICFASNISMNFHAVQYLVGTTKAATATPLTLTGGTNSCNYVVLELFAQVAGNFMPSSGIYVFGYKTALNGDIAASPWKAFMPNVGTCLALIEDDGSLRSAPTDTAGGTWVLDVTGSTAPVSAAAHAAGLAPSQSRIITFVVSSLPQNTNYCIFDVVRCSGVVQKVTFPSTAEGTSWVGTCAITPLKANGLVINFAGTGIGPILSQTQPAGAYYLSQNYTGETDTDDMINANGLSMYYYGASLSAQSYGYTIAAGTSINATALELGLLIPLDVDDADFDHLCLRRAIPDPDKPVTVFS